MMPRGYFVLIALVPILLLAIYLIFGLILGGHGSSDLTREWIAIWFVGSFAILVRGSTVRPC